MTPEAQRLAIAKVHRPELVKAREEANRMLKAITNGVYPIVELESYPQYLHDLNAIHEVEKTLGSNWRAYDAQLERICARDCKDEDDHFCPWHANAAQRVEAFLRTLGKWTDS